MSERYIVIPNWDRFQHYKGQERPAWIKLHVSVLHDDEFLSLTIPQRMTLVGIWILYAESGRKLSENTSKLSRQLGHRVTKRTLESLNQAGLIEFRSRDALEKLYTQKRREEKRREDPPSIPPAQSPNPLLEFETAEKKGANGKSGYVHNLSSYTGCRIVRGEVGISHVYDPLGTEPKPQGWPHPTPSRAEIAQALNERNRQAIA